MRSASYGAPSWSWASIDGQVSYLEASTKGEHCQATLIDAYTTTSVDPFGAVTTGSIHMRGPLVHLQLKLEEERRGS